MINAAPSNVWEFLTSFDAGDRFPLVIVIIVFGVMGLVFTVGIIAFTIRSIQKNRLDDALKRELLDRGMSAEEIALVIRTKLPASDADKLRAP